MLKKIDNKIIVTAPIIELYLPAEYAQKSNLYTMKGERVEFFGVCNMKKFDNEAGLENRSAAKTIPVGIPMILISNPSEIESNVQVQFYPDGPFRKCIVLRYYKDDEIVCNTQCIRSADNVTALMEMLENGKLTFFPVKYIPALIQKVQDMNKVNLRLPTESIQAMIAERYRDPEHPSKKLRFAKDPDSDDIVSVTPREETMLSSTYSAFSFEDINSSLIASVNRAKAGIHDEPTIMEKIIRGGTVTDND